MQPLQQHYYAVLGLDSSATPEQVRRAWLDLAQVWHPDRFQANARLRAKAEEKLQEINEAYHALAHGHPQPHAREAEGPPRSAEPAWRAAAYARRSFPFAEYAARYMRLLARLARVQWKVLSFAIPVIWLAGLVVMALAVAGFFYRAMTIPLGDREVILARAARASAPHVPPVWEMLPGGLGDRLFRAFGPQPQSHSPGAVPMHAGQSGGEEPGRIQHERRRSASLPPANGADLIPSQLRYGVGVLKIVNLSAHGAAAEIASETAPQAPLRIVYAGAGQEALLDDIGPGSYLITVRMGNTWQPERRRFAERVPAAGPFGPFHFVQIRDEKGIRSDRYELVLKAPPGN